jgi:predicted outer membrane repeat protein
VSSIFSIGYKNWEDLMSKFFRLSALFALLVSLVGGAVTYTPASAASIRFVKTAGVSSGSCTTWATACTLQWAISISLVGDQIWVQAGTYIPHPSDRTVSFKLKNELPIYGGFNGTETQLAQRKPAANVTILSGDLKGNDGPNFTNNGENSYHVVTTSHANSATILDGFTIRGGNANVGDWNDATGGGMRNTNGSNPTLRNLTFSSNFAIKHGGGMFNSQSNPSLTNVTFSDNSAGQGGGGMYNDLAKNPTLTDVRFLRNKADTGGGMTNYSSSPVLMDVIFSENSATYGGGMNNFLVDNPPIDNPKLTRVIFDRNSATSGGGLYNKGDSATLTDVQFLGNKATYDGGGMINDNSSPSLTNVTFSENSAKAGGGMLNVNNSNPKLKNATFGGNSADDVGGGLYNNASSPELTDVTFRGNSADVGGGGGMYNLEGSNPTLTKVTFDMNSTNSWGGGMFNKNGSPSLTNVTFSSNRTINSTNSWGGGMFNENSSPSLTNVTFSGNEAADGGGIYSYNNNNNNNNSQLTLTNTIIANSLRGGDCVNPSTTLDPASTNNLIEDPSSACGLKNGENGNIIGVDPKLGPLANNGGVTQTHALLAGSPAINAGNDDNCPTIDQRGVTRPQGSHCDIGSYEFTSPITITINGVLQGTVIPKNNAGSFSFPQDAGPVQVNRTSGEPFVASQRVIFPKGGNNPTSFSEMLGLPASQVGTRVSFPAYDNVNFNSQLHIANIGNSTATVRLRIKGNEMTSGCTPSNSPFTIAKGTSIRVSCAANEGPLVLDSPGVLIATSLRTVPKSNNGSYSEIMGLPQKQADTGYIFPWYNNATLNSQLRVANIGAAPTNVTVTIGGVRMAGTPFSLPANTSKRISFAGINGGPVRVTSSGSVPIVASIRVLFPKSGVAPFTGFSEVMGIPQKLVGTAYHFPWYNNATLDSQLRVANVSNSPATVHILIGGQEMAGSPFTLAAGAVTSRSFAGVGKGPVKIESNQTIVASLRILLPKNVGTPTYFSEVIGLPHSLLSTNYYFPWYNNVTLDTQLRIGVP